MGAFYKNSDEEVIEALRESHGLISVAARKLGLKSSNALRDRIRKNPEMTQVMKEAREEVLDLAESGMIKKLKAEDPNMIQFTLRHLGSSRGYIDSTHFSVEGNLDVNANVDLSVLSMEELQKLNELISKTTSNKDSD